MVNRGRFKVTIKLVGAERQEESTAVVVSRSARSETAVGVPWRGASKAPSRQSQLDCLAYASQPMDHHAASPEIKRMHD